MGISVAGFVRGGLKEHHHRPPADENLDHLYGKEAISMSMSVTLSKLAATLFSLLLALCAERAPKRRSAAGNMVTRSSPIALLAHLTHLNGSTDRP